MPFTSADNHRTHLYEVHMLKPSCPICLTEFKDSEARDQHIRKRGCVEKDAPRGTRGLTNEMRDQIKDRRGIQRMPKEKHWEKIWKILFRDAPAPSDPYQEPDPETAAEQATLRKFLNKYKEDIKKEAVERTTQGGKDIIPFELLQRLAPVLNDAIGKAISSAVSSALKAAPEALGTGALQGDPESSRAGSLSLPRENSHVESLDYGNFQGRFHQATSLEPGEWIEAGPLQESQGDAQHVLPDGTDVSRLSNILFDDGPGSWDLGQGMAEGGGQYTDPAQPGGCMDPSLLKYNDSLPGV
ncbi:hypothetical protein B0I35DRAFT_434500 [Stachybotrys elegans]|uniref:C2H2-type domain-containing protein n=1 Tax=Stachybotrys elegans TaxID=80388 RepID=A0A8K0WRY5_9HYPO|nr:hypothetical protein B0I35DRAFT_434500 [Stachybotrys elegans]